VPCRRRLPGDDPEQADPFPDSTQLALQIAQLLDLGDQLLLASFERLHGRREDVLHLSPLLELLA
jgi:hypothetical protein